MAEKKRSIVDYGIQIVRELIVGRLSGKEEETAAKEIKLEDLKLDDLRREKIRLDQEERKMLSRLREVENRKRQLFEEGVRNASEREQRVIARGIKELDLEAQNMDRMMQVISKQMRIINGLVKVKENDRLMSESGVTSLLHNIDLQDLIIYIDRASVNGEFHLDKFDELLRTLEQNDAISPQMSEDADVLNIVSQMQRAREAADSPAAIEERFSEMDRKLHERSQKDMESPEEEF